MLRNYSVLGPGISRSHLAGQLIGWRRGNASRDVPPNRLGLLEGLYSVDEKDLSRLAAKIITTSLVIPQSQLLTPTSLSPTSCVLCPSAPPSPLPHLSSVARANILNRSHHYHDQIVVPVHP
ncbi:conserved hypothetical protein [Coccidioides posadasii str. Silveira]|uniref:Uncharacterized protein n=2 Tax=Coccidioides posadasii TaxID=199306 RepID=E9DG89_COCPS|nr:conserved hypothetical protein [Coccidioides posadasii str. Silveira]KMM68353.1 hypothetical protein CPAG_04682 [Coccidioides posadasii RMSCC 3488]